MGFSNLPKDMVTQVTELLEKIRAKDKSDNEQLYKDAAVKAHSGLPELGEVCGDEHDKLEEDDKEDERVEGPPHAKKAGAVAVAVQEDTYASPEPSSAVGFRSQEEVAKHADLVHDISIVGVEKFDGYRLLVQYPNHRCELVPSSDLPPAPSIESLRALSSGIPDTHGVIAAALAVVNSGPSEGSKEGV